jgi:hypothetical protein
MIDLVGKRIAFLADYINRNLPYTAEVVRGYCNTDRHISGTRLRSPGKGRWGNRLIVRDWGGCVVFDHNSAETYRTNSEIVDWIKKQEKKP